jgi:hypothetical protein
MQNSFSEERQGKQFFFEKKNQKTFAPAGFGNFNDDIIRHQC